MSEMGKKYELPGIRTQGILDIEIEKENSGLSGNLNLGQLGKRERYLCAVLCYCPLSHPFSAVAKYLILEIVLEDQKHAGAERQKTIQF